MPRRYRCDECGFAARSFYWHCPACQSWADFRVLRARQTALKIRYDLPMPTHQSVKTCVFPVAGRGTRFLPVTKASPKEMLPIVDKPLIQYAVDEALSAGAETLGLHHRKFEAGHRGSFRQQSGAREPCCRRRASRNCSTPCTASCRAGHRACTSASRRRLGWVMPCCARGPWSAMRPSWCISPTI